MNQRGHVLTNYHVIADADQIIVALQDGPGIQCKLVGTDKLTDLAVLYIESDNLPVIPRDPDRLPDVGTWCSPSATPTTSARPSPRASSAPPGVSAPSSMGPTAMADRICCRPMPPSNEGKLRGALSTAVAIQVGITAAYHLNGNQESYGISFAIPTKLAKRIMDELIANGRVIRGYSGISSVEINPIVARMLNLGDLRGLVVESLIPMAQPPRPVSNGDVLLKINGEVITGVRPVMDKIVRAAPAPASPCAIRNGKPLDVDRHHRRGPALPESNPADQQCGTRHLRRISQARQGPFLFRFPRLPPVCETAHTLRQ